MLGLIFIFSWATVSALIVGLAMSGERAIVRERVQSLRLTDTIDVEQAAPELAIPFRDRVLIPFIRSVGQAFSRLLPVNPKVIAAKLEQAGNPWKLRPADFAGLKALSILVFLAGAIVFAVFVDTQPAYKVVAIAAGALIGFALPDSILEQAIRERHRAMRKALANCLDLLVISAEAGLGFDGALAKAVDRTSGPLTDEFRRALHDMSVGRSRMEALKAMAERVGLMELTSFVAAVHQADQLGASIAHVLRVQADSLRVQRSLRARQAAATLPVRLLFPLVLFIFPAIFIVILGPGLMTLFRALGITR